jgi:tRNA(Met) C34 N-acetyltransferase TmcA
MVTCSATANQINVLSTVFGKRDSLTDFWRRNQFFQFYQGEKRDKASGAVNVLWVKPLSTDAQALFERYMVLPVDAHLKKVQDFIDKTRPLSAIRQSLLALEHELDHVKLKRHGQLINLLTSLPFAPEANLCSLLNLNGKQALYDLTRGLLKQFMEMRT